MKNLFERRRLPALTISLALAALFTLNASATVEQDEFVLRNVTLAHRKIFEGGDFFQDVVDTSGGRIVVRDRTMGPLPPMTRSHAVWKVRHFLFGCKLFRKLSPPFDIGRYNECRPKMYEELISGVSKSAGFSGERNIHMGLDIGGPPGTVVRSFHNCTVLHFGYNPAAYDYGHVIVTHQVIAGRDVYALYGHLSAKSVQFTYKGKVIKKGEPIGWMGAEHENGGWPVHLHLQLSLQRPEGHDMPGVVSISDHRRALEQFPDPRWVVGDMGYEMAKEDFFGQAGGRCK